MFFELAAPYIEQTSNSSFPDSIHPEQQLACLEQVIRLVHQLHPRINGTRSWPLGIQLIHFFDHLDPLIDTST